MFCLYTNIHHASCSTKSLKNWRIGVAETLDEVSLLCCTVVLPKTFLFMCKKLVSISARCVQWRHISVLRSFYAHLNEAVVGASRSPDLISRWRREKWPNSPHSIPLAQIPKAERTRTQCSAVGKAAFYQHIYQNSSFEIHSFQFRFSLFHQ